MSIVKKRSKKLLAILIAMIMVLGIAPLTAMADPGNGGGDPSYSVTYFTGDADVEGAAPEDNNFYESGDLATVLEPTGMSLTKEQEDIENGGTYLQEYVFAGWNTESDGTGDVFQPGEVIAISGDVSLYAMWEEKAEDPFELPGGGGTIIVPPPDPNGGNEEIPGALIIDKKAVPGQNTDEDAGIWEWDITLTLRGLDLITTSDIVLVIDVSGSMDSNNRLDAAKAAANRFINDLITNGNGKTQIAIVPYEGVIRTGTNYSTFLGLNAGDDALLNTVVNSLTANGGTYTQLGIKTARDLLGASTASNKYIVLLSDGDPTYSAPLTGTSGIQAIQSSQQILWWTTYSFDYWQIAEDYTLTYNYNGRVGNGNSFTNGASSTNIAGNLNSGNTYAFPPNSNQTVTGLGGYIVTPTVPTTRNHGFPTEYDAKLAKEAGYEFYSVGVGSSLSADGQKMLENCSSGSGYYYVVPDTTNTNNLVNVLADIAGKISYAASNAVVTDPMGEYFEMVGAGTVTAITTSQGTATWNSTTETIEWNVGDVKESDGPITMTYTVRIDATPGVTDPYTMYPTNKKTTVTYTDVNGDDSSKDFPIPQVGYPQVGTITKYIYLLNDDDLPTNIQGTVVTIRDDIDIYDTVKVENPSPVSTDVYVFPYDTYTVTADATIIVNVNGTDYIYEFVPGNADNLGDLSPTSVTVDVHNQSARVYYAYRLKVSYNVIYDGNTSDGGTAVSDSTDYAYGDKVTVLDNTWTKTGYYFTGWNTQADGNGADYDEGDEFNMPKGDVKLYAQWAINKYSISYSYTGVVPASVPWIPMSEFSVPYGTAKTVKAAPTVEGYTFVGWIADGVTPDSDGDYKMPDNNVKFTGSWVKISGLNVYYDGNGDDGGTAVVDGDNPYSFNDEVTVLDNTWTREGYVFLKWNTEADGSGTDYDPEDIFKMPAKDVTLYAQWMDDGSGSEFKKEVTSEAGSYEAGDTVEFAISFYLPEDFNGIERIIITDEYDPDVLKLIGFTLTIDGGDVFINPDATADGILSLTLLFDLIVQYPGAKVELNAEFEILDTDEAISNKAFLFYNSIDTEPVKETEVTLYKVKYNANGGTGTLPIDSKVYKAGETVTVKDSALTMTSYTFNGWLYNSATYQADGTFYMPAANVTLVAQWQQSGGGTPPTIITTPPPPLAEIEDEGPPLAELDIVNHFVYIIGYEDDTVRPNKNITRAEAATIFFRLLTQDSRVEIWSKANSFSDVAADNWFNNAVSTLANGGILNGYADGTFRPNATITRAELAAIAVRFQYHGDISSYPTGLPTFSDIGGHWAENYIRLASDLGYVNGYPDGTFKPNEPITRAEVATLLNNVLDRQVESDEDMLPGMKTWSDNPKGAWYYFAIQEATNSHYFDRKDGSIYEVWTEIRQNPEWSALEKTTSTPYDISY